MKVKSVLVPTGAVRGVLGTLHLKTKCHYHGGAKGSGGQLANRNALKSGVYETVVYRRLSEGEQHLFDSVTTEPDLRSELHNPTIENALPLPDNRGEDVRTVYRSGELKEEALWLIQRRRRGRAR
jgi:hypothetical protein